MASSKLLKEAIADAKAVRETAIANAKIALEEAFTPRLQSILSQKLQAEMEGDDDDKGEEVNEDNDVSTDIGKGDNKMPADKAYSAQTDLSGISKQSGEPGSEVEDYDKVKDLTEGEDEMGDDESHEEAPAMEGEDAMAPEHDGEESHDEDELDLESIIRELEAQIAQEGGEDEESHEEAPAMEGDEEAPTHAEPDADNAGGPSDHDADNVTDEEIDLDEILREMGYGDDEDSQEDAKEDDAEMKAEVARLQSELQEALDAIKSLRGTINEVNLLNAKLLYANKLFRGYSLTNEQKVKVVENLDRTSSVREVKLVYATLAESMKFGGTERKIAPKKTMTEGVASKAQASTAPTKEIIAESSNELANRFKQLAGIVK
jgi:hypothetical protein